MANKVILREYTKEEELADKRKLLNQKGLAGAVKFYCDKVDKVAGSLAYLPHREIQEYLCDIMKVVELYESDTNNIKRSDKDKR